MRRFDSSPLSPPGKQSVMFSLARAQTERKKTKHNLSKISQRPKNPQSQPLLKTLCKKEGRVGLLRSRKHGDMRC